ncbi:MAG: pyruvate, phosphate dikinase [Deltaproteobacteria bacterium]|nr:pyruvate, phosphate dikinase [Deltaproteobacteria bacterium]
MIQSRALEENLARYRVDVIPDPKYEVLEDIMSDYYGLLDGLHSFIKELSHPYRNWHHVVKEARGYALNYLHLLKNHPRGPEAAKRFTGIFFEAIQSTSDMMLRAEAADNLLLFIQKLIKEMGSDLKRFIPILQETFNRIRNHEGEDFFLFLKSYYRLNRMAERFVSATSESVTDYEALNRLLLKYFRETYTYWLQEDDPQRWFENETGELRKSEKLYDIFYPISHEHLRQLSHNLESISAQSRIESKELTTELTRLPGYNEIVESYRVIPRKLSVTGETDLESNRWKLIFVFQILNIPGLSLLHEEALRESNRTLSELIGHEESSQREELVRKTFSILKTQSRKFPDTALNCMFNIGKAVYGTEDTDLIDFFIDSVIDLGFQLPQVGGVGDDWQIRANSAHILNIRIWLRLIELNPKLSKRLLSALIVYLSLCGVFIKDTDLFPKDVTGLLNSEIVPVYNLVKQLARLFPVYFNDIGAEGRLRDISTRIDELCGRKDVLIHFLRKQSHVESSNRIIGFMEATLYFWETRDKTRLQPYIPPAIYDQIQSHGPFIDGVHRTVALLKKRGVSLPRGLLSFHESELRSIAGDHPDVSENDLERVSLAISLYKMFNQKYRLDFIETDQFVSQLRPDVFPKLDELKAALAEKNLKRKLDGLLNYLDVLKTLILSPKTFDIREDIYKKRHITVDIPSMYGSYHEMKFDALGLTFRLEGIINVLFEELIENIDLNLITKATFFQVNDRLKLLYKALKLDGILSVEIERQLELLNHSLQVRGFTFTQYIDIFKGFAQAVKNIIDDYFNNVHERNLKRILSRLTSEQILSKYLPGENHFDNESLEHRVSEIFFRERIAISLGLQQMDRFLSRIINTLFQQLDTLPNDKLQQLLLYDPERAMTPIDKTGRRVSGIIHLGNKGRNLVKLKQYGLPIPPGFIITTEVFRCRNVINAYGPAKQNFKEQITHHISYIEKLTGSRFGDPSNPLLFSVRSGSSISQPGMMDTFLDVGINEQIVCGIISRTGNKWFAWDNYRRFLQCYGMSYGLNRDEFDAIIDDFKQKLGIPFKRDFSGDQMQQVALTYKKMVLDSGIEIEEDPFEQLYLIIGRVFESWESAKAKAYRKIMGISDDWGTAVTVQTMVYGNISRQSGSGVLFTHNPKLPGDTLRLWGDFTIGNQGEDVVAGLVRTLPISVIQKNYEMRQTDVTLQTHFPKIYMALKNWANDLIYEKGWSPQEIEFTFEGPDVKDLYLLQTRDMVIRGQKDVYTFDLEGQEKRSLLGHGIGVSGGAMVGRVVFSLEEIDQWRHQEPETFLILVRSDTVPDDIQEIYAADGLLTARGGLTSHAAVVAHRLGKTCVVGCADLICNEKRKEAVWNRVTLRSGDYISIDGQQGAVYLGRLKVKKARHR